MAHASPRPLQSNRRTLALLIAPQRRSGLHELAQDECSAALPFAHGLRVIDFQLGNLMRAGIDEVIVLQPGLPRSCLRDHIRRVWRKGFRRIACIGGYSVADDQGLKELHRFLALIDGINPDDLLLLSADHICDPDLAKLTAIHQLERNLVTLGAHGSGDELGSGAVGEWITALNAGIKTGIGLMVVDWKWLKGHLGEQVQIDDSLPQQVIMAASREAGLQIRDVGDARLYWRRLDCLDTFRVTWLDFLCNPTLPCGLPLPPDATRAFSDLPPPQTNVRDSVIMPGGSVGPRAMVSRAIIAPGAHVPDGMVIGQDSEFDSRMFRQTPAGTTLVTADMLAAAAPSRRERESANGC